MKEITIERVHVSTISISGKMDDSMRAKIAQWIQLAAKYTGRILR